MNLKQMSDVQLETLRLKFANAVDKMLAQAQQEHIDCLRNFNDNMRPQMGNPTVGIALIGTLFAQCYFEKEMVEREIFERSMV